MFYNKFGVAINLKFKAMYRSFLRRLIESAVNDIRLYTFLCFGPKDRLIIHPTAIVQNAFFNTISGKITICELALIAHNVSILTGSHDVYSKNEKRHPPAPAINDICVMRGAWIASNAVILGPCVIGENAVVAAGSIVIHDVPPNTMVAGNPATIKKVI